MNPNTSLTALVVDDNFYNRALCIRALSHSGFQVTEAENGLRAISFLVEQTYDLLIVDLHLPGIDGSHLIQYLDRPALHHPLYVMVMTANPHMVTDEMWAQVDFVLYKPIDVKSFVGLTSRLADGKKAMEQARLVS